MLMSKKAIAHVRSLLHKLSIIHFENVYILKCTINLFNAKLNTGLKEK